MFSIVITCALIPQSIVDPCRHFVLPILASGVDFFFFFFFFFFLLSWDCGTCIMQLLTFKLTFALFFHKQLSYFHWMSHIICSLLYKLWKHLSLQSHLSLLQLSGDMCLQNSLYSILKMKCKVYLKWTCEIQSPMWEPLNVTHAGCWKFGSIRSLTVLFTKKFLLCCRSFLSLKASYSSQLEYWNLVLSLFTLLFFPSLSLVLIEPVLKNTHV